jgi:predicted nucleic acid-binding protein
VRLVVDASVLVGSLLRPSGRLRLGHPALQLHCPEYMIAEAEHELDRRIRLIAQRAGFDATDETALRSAATEAMARHLAVLLESSYRGLADEARRRCARDPNDWHVVAAALMLDAAIWTADKDFLGAGVATWTTQTLDLWLAHHADEFT